MPPEAKKQRSAKILIIAGIILLTAIVVLWKFAAPNINPPPVDAEGIEKELESLDQATEDF